MSMKSLGSNFNYLMNELGCDKRSRALINLVLDKLIDSDLRRKTKFEYSLQIKNGKLNNNFRFVNYGMYYLPREQSLYLKRVDLIDNLVIACTGNDQALRRLFGLVRRYKEFRLPVYFGIETQNNGRFSLKVYLNFFNIYKINRPFGRQLVSAILGGLGLKTKINEFQVPLLGFSTDVSGRIVNHKIYYLYGKEHDLSKAGFSRRELDIFYWLNQFNRFDYFDIMNRYSGGTLVSKKLEVHPKLTANFLTGFCSRIGAENLLLKIKAMIKRTSGRIEAVTLEKDIFTIYVKLLDYGSGRTVGL